MLGIRLKLENCYDPISDFKQYIENIKKIIRDVKLVLFLKNQLIL